jgi:primosomal protein N' (replication factor Y)
VVLAKPLRLKRETVQLSRVSARMEPFVQVLVDHRVVHLDQYFEYQVPENLSARAIVGALVEIEFGSSITLGLIVDRYSQPLSGGSIKFLNKILSTDAYILPDQIANIQRAAKLYGVKPWDFIRTCVPPFSKMGERANQQTPKEVGSGASPTTDLPKVLIDSLLAEGHLVCAIEIPTSRNYWNIVAAVAASRLSLGSVLLLVPNEREMLLLERTLHDLSLEPILVSSTQGKSERYLNYLRGRSKSATILIGTRSAALFSLPANSTIILLDDVDESHYERQSPTWNTRELIALRESEFSTIYISVSLSLEIAHRVLRAELRLYQFPSTVPFKVQSATSDIDRGYFELIRTGLSKGSVLLSVGAVGYITSFSCQKCINIALCSCGGKLYFPTKGSNPICSICQSEFLEWSCSWCQGNKPRVIGSGVARRAEEFGRSFPNHPVITSTATHPIASLPQGNHLVLSTPGVEPRGQYAAEVFLDLEHRLLRTTLRASEEIRLHIHRDLSMLVPGGSVYFSLQPSDAFLQSILRAGALVTAAREIEERDAVCLPPDFLAILISSENIEGVIQVLQQKLRLDILGPFVRGGKRTILLKVPMARRGEITELLLQINKVQSMRKSPLMTYQINPYSLN